MSVLEKNKIRIKKQNLAQWLNICSDISFKKLKSIVTRHNLDGNQIKGTVIIETNENYIFFNKYGQHVYNKNLNVDYGHGINSYDSNGINKLEEVITSIKIISVPININQLLNYSSYYKTNKANKRFVDFIKKKQVKEDRKKNRILKKLESIDQNNFTIIKSETKYLYENNELIQNRYLVVIPNNIYGIKIEYKILLGDHITTNYETKDSIPTKGWFLAINTDTIKLGRYITDQGSLDNFYTHSHISSVPFTHSSIYCTNGRDFLEIPKMEILNYINTPELSTIKNDFEFELCLLNFCYQMIEYIKQESITGIPFKEIANVKKDLFDKYLSANKLPIDNNVDYLYPEKFTNYIFDKYTIDDLIDKKILVYNIFKKSYYFTRDYTTQILKEKYLLNYLITNNNLSIRLIDKYVVNDEEENDTDEILSSEGELEYLRIRYKRVSIKGYKKLIDILKNSEDFVIKTKLNIRNVIGYTQDTIYISNVEDTVINPRDLVKTELSTENIKIYGDMGMLTVYINKKIKEINEKTTVEQQENRAEERTEEVASN